MATAWVRRASVLRESVKRLAGVVSILWFWEVR